MKDGIYHVKVLVSVSLLAPSCIQRNHHGKSTLLDVCVMEQRDESEEREVSILLTADPYDLTDQLGSQTPGRFVKSEPSEEDSTNSALLRQSELVCLQ